MIFVTVGGQLPFDRLIAAADRFAAKTNEPVIAQTLNERKWASLRSVHSLPFAEFQNHCRKARVIIGHAGIGTYLTARDLQKPLIVLPRRMSLKEHRTDHQVHTAEALANQSGVRVIWEVEDLEGVLRGDLEPVAGVCSTYQGLLAAVATAVA